MKPKRMRLKWPKRSIKARTALCRAVGLLLPQCELAQQHPDVAASGAKMVQMGTQLEASQAKVDAAEALAASARHERDALESSLFTATEHYGATVLLYAESSADVKSAGLDLIERQKHSLLPPGQIYAAYDVLHNVVELSLDGAPGIDTYKFEQCAGPAPKEEDFEDVPGMGSTRKIAGLAPGMYWFRVKSARGNLDSGYVGPVSVLVK